LKHGATVYAHDPLFSERELCELGYTPLFGEHENEIAAIILQASHQAFLKFDFSRFTHCQVVLDGRRALSRERIESLGMCYIVIGDGHQEKPDQEKDQEVRVPSASQTGGYR
jgi:UDP-N-acetyl-D-mannosaminuronate dehydrogenase